MIDIRVERYGAVWIVWGPSRVNAHIMYKGFKVTGHAGRTVKCAAMVALKRMTVKLIKRVLHSD